MTWTNLLGQVRVGIRGSVSQSQTQSLLLDTYSGAAAAYSLRKLNTSYTGYAIRVRRSSDNTEQNIGFNADGTLNTLALLAFVGSGNGFVTTWYDQSGNGRDITQTTASNQPKIVNAGSIYRLNGLPSVYFYDNWLFSSLLNMPINNVTNTTVSSSFTTDSLGWGGVNYQSILSFGALSEYMGYATYYTYSNGQFEFNSESRFSNYNGQKTSTSLNKVNLSFNYNGYTQILSWLNSNSFGSSTFANSNLSTQQYLTVGSRWHGSGFYFHLRGYVSEAIIWNTDKTSNRTQIESNINTYYSIYATDTDAQAFINAASITDGTQIRAIDTLVTSLKSAGIWTKMKAIYPFVGGSAASHKFNLKDPRDLDVAYRITFSGGMTHSSSGVLFGGSNGYANLNINANQIFTSTDGLMGIYTSNSSLTGGNSIFATSNMADSEWGMYYASGKIYFGMYRSNTTQVTSTLPGFSAIGMETNGQRSIYKNGNRIVNSSDGFIPLPQNLKIYMSARNANGTADGFSGAQYSFAFISNTLTLLENLAFYNAVQTYQTTLGRQV